MIVNYVLLMTLFALLLLFALISIFLIMISVYIPKWRIWPPPNYKTWQFYVWWVLITFIQLGYLLLGILDWEKLNNFHMIAIMFSIPIFIIGINIVITGTKQLSFFQTLGLGGELHIQGLYEYSRNPQYVGYILINFAIILFTYSFYCLVVGILIIVHYLVLPFPEEKWLKEKYNGFYTEYFLTTPRFGLFQLVKNLK